MKKNTRRAPRFRVAGLDMIYDTGDAFWIAPVIDASALGLFLETAHDLPVGTVVTLHPEGPGDDTHLPFEIRGQVVRVNEFDHEKNFQRLPGIALQLMGLTADEVTALHTYLQNHGVPLPAAMA